MSRETPAGVATVAQLCKAFGFSRAAYYAARKDVPEEGAKAKVLRLPTPPRGTSAEVVLKAIREVLEENPAWGVRKVWATLRREKGLRVGRRRVWSLMRAHGLVLAKDREPGETTRGHVVVPECNRRLATDFTTTWTKEDGVVAIVPVIDCGCRSVLALEVTKSQEAPDVLAPVERALEAEYGTPQNVPEGLEVRSDHGPHPGRLGRAAHLRARGKAHRQRGGGALHPHHEGGGGVAARLEERRRAARRTRGVGAPLQHPSPPPGARLEDARRGAGGEARQATTAEGSRVAAPHRHAALTRPFPPASVS